MSKSHELDKLENRIRILKIEKANLKKNLENADKRIFGLNRQLTAAEMVCFNWSSLHCDLQGSGQVPTEFNSYYALMASTEEWVEARKASAKTSGKNF